MKKRYGLTAAAATLLLLSACSNPGSGAGRGPSGLVIGAGQEPPSISDPWLTNNLSISAEINALTTASLTIRDNDGNQQPDIATEVPTEANGRYTLNRDASGQVVSNSLTYTIRPEAKWSDGTAITPADFQFWLNVYQDERVPVPDRFPYSNATITVSESDPATFTLTYEPPYLFAQTAGQPGLAPAHVMRAGWEAFDQATKGQEPGEALQAEWTKFISGYTTSSTPPKVVSGAFVPETWTAGSTLSLKRNANYWREPEGGADKYLQTVTYRFIPNTNTLKLNLLSGELGALSATGVTFDQALDLQQRQGEKFTTYFVPGAVWEHIDINTRGERSQKLGLNDARVRQALLYGIDRSAMTQALFQGKEPVSNTFVNPLAGVYAEDVPTYEYNPERAKELLAQAGWTPGGDGILQKNGQKLALTFSTTAGNAVRERVQQILQAQWKKIGVQVNIQNYPASVFFGPDMLSKGEEGKWDLAMYAWVSDPTLEDGSLFKASGIPTAAHGYSGQNNSGWNNARYNELQKAAETNFDEASRKAQFAEMQKIWAEEVPALPLYFRSNPYAQQKDLVNYDFSAITQYPTWDAFRLGWGESGAASAHTQQ